MFELREALHGRITTHHRTVLKLHLDIVLALEHTPAELGATLGTALAPIRQYMRLLITMPGVSDVTAQVILAEVGADMTRFPGAGHLISWAGLCPGSDESAGKRHSIRVRKRGTWLKCTLVTAAWAAVRVRSSYLHGQFLRIKARRGPRAFRQFLRVLQGCTRSQCVPTFADWPVPGDVTLRCNAQTLLVHVTRSNEPLHFLKGDTNMVRHSGGERKVHQHGYSKRPRLP